MEYMAYFSTAQWFASVSQSVCQSVPPIDILPPSDSPSLTTSIQFYPCLPNEEMLDVY